MTTPTISFTKNFLIGIGCFISASLAFADEIAVNLHANDQEIYEHTKVIQRVAITNPSIVNVEILSPNSFLMTPIDIGATTIKVWDKSETNTPSKIIALTVSKSNALESLALDKTELGEFNVESAGNVLEVTGAAASLENHEQALAAIKQDPESIIDKVGTTFESLVQIDIKIVELSRKNVQRFGLYLGRNNGESTAVAIAQPNTLTSVTNDAGGFQFNSGTGFIPVLNAFNVAIGNGKSGLLSTISALESNGFAYTLAEPSLSAMSGQTATFLAGGELPVPVRTGSAASDSAITIQYKEYGVRLMLTPTVLDKERIFMKISPEISEIDFENAVQTGGVAVPGLKVRRTDTTVSMADGESFVISGMVSSSALNNVDKFPWLGNIPIIGAFFKSKRFDREDKELLMIVTPHLVNPIAKGAKLPPLPGREYENYKPSFSEFLFGDDEPSKVNSGMSH